MWILISRQHLEESSLNPISSQGESWFPVFDESGEPTFQKHLKRSFPSAIGMWEGPWVCCLKWSGYQDALPSKNVAFPWSGLNAGFSFISQDEGMSESPVESLEKTLVPRLIWTGGPQIPWHLERPAGFKALKGEEAWLFLKIDRNPKISVETRKGSLVSQLTSRSLCIILPNLV